MTNEIDLSNTCSKEQVDNNYFAMQNLLDDLVAKNEISQYLENDLLTELNTASHNVDEQRRIIGMLLNKVGLKQEVFDKEVKKITAALKRKKIEKAFEETSSLLKIDNYLDNAKRFYNFQPYFYDKQELFWFWRENRWEIVDEVEVSRELDKHLGFVGQTVSATIKNNHLTALKWVGREKIPKPAKVHWIQFKDKAFTLSKKLVYKVTPDFFFTNPIPWDIGKDDKTPTMDRLFQEWVGKDYIQTLYEIIAYCCYPSYPIQTLFCLYGNGRNGKSCFLRLLTKFIGINNLCSTELDLLVGISSSRFEKAKLYKKLVCQMGETNFGILTKSSILKQLTGGDMIGFEMKGKNPFDEYSYAKILIASNSLPSSEDTSEGFYRRWVIIDFPNQFPEGNDILESIPDIEYHNLANKVTKILPQLLKNGKFTNQGDIEQRKQRYIMASNPFSMFVKETCEVGHDKYIRYSKLYNNYVAWLSKHKRRIVGHKEFNTVLSMEGYEVDKNTRQDEKGEWISTRWIYGLSESICPICPECSISHSEKSHIGVSGKVSISGISVILEENLQENEQKLEIIHYRCDACGQEPSNWWGKNGKPYCNLCYNTRVVNHLE